MSDVSHLAGPLLLGYMLNWGLYGALSVQVCTSSSSLLVSVVDMESPKDAYWISFPEDRRIPQALVYTIYVLETAQTISLTCDAFQQFVFGFSDPASINNSQNSWLNACIVDGIVALLYQVFFANRIRVLRPKNKVIPGIIVLFSIAQLVGAIGTAVATKRAPAFSQEIDIGFPHVWLACAAAADILIALTTVHALSSYDTSFKETRDVVRRFKLLAMETNSLIAVMDILPVILYHFYPDRNYYLTPGLVVAKLYSNSLLAIFNARVRADDARTCRGFRANARSTWRASIMPTSPTIPMSVHQERTGAIRFVDDSNDSQGFWSK
ncbi:hypothetical protein VNI00_004271 [Paramarasmius palmivorus]|uniref:DUF6534 domain-containing protein n=1 Tax=Paramarasmius palmivorus TaxID=297713 RepID=A0AAW0DQ27_9AGAR